MESEAEELARAVVSETGLPAKGLVGTLELGWAVAWGLEWVPGLAKGSGPSLLVGRSEWATVWVADVAWDEATL
jgi:hypothetical protein